MMKRTNNILVILILILLIVPSKVHASNIINMDINGDAADTIEILAFMTIMSVMPAIIIMTTSFTRIIMVLSFLKSGLGLQQAPPSQVLVGLALFLTLFIMSPVIGEINTEAYQPYKAEQITQQEFIDEASKPLKEFMLKQTDEDELQMFIDMSQDEEIKNVESAEELPLTVIIPSFATSELKKAFMIGFLLMVPFLIIDLIVSSVLLSMGMMMLPPVMISMPFKILLFVVVDGWSLLFKTLITTFN